MSHSLISALVLTINIFSPSNLNAKDLAVKDPIAALVEKLNPTNEIWKNGAYKPVNLPANADPEKVVSAFLEDAVKDLKLEGIVTIKTVEISQKKYYAALVETNLGKKIIMAAWQSPEWWAKIFDVDEAQSTIKTVAKIQQDETINLLKRFDAIPDLFAIAVKEAESESDKSPYEIQERIENDYAKKHKAYRYSIPFRNQRTCSTGEHEFTETTYKLVSKAQKNGNHKTVEVSEYDIHEIRFHGGVFKPKIVDFLKQLEM